MDEAGPMEGSYKALQDHINKITETQNTFIAKFDGLTKNVEDLRKILSQFADKVLSLEEVATDRRKLKMEIKVLKNRIDELYAIVKEGKEDDSCPSEVHEIESNHSGFSSSSKVRTSIILKFLFLFV